MKKIKINWKSVVEEVSCFILASITAYIVEEYIWGSKVNVPFSYDNYEATNAIICPQENLRVSFHEYLLSLIILIF